MTNPLPPQPAPIDIEELERLAKAAADSWESSHSGRCWYSAGVTIDAIADDDDGAFIAEASPAAVLALIAEVRALRGVKLAIHALAAKPTASAFGVVMEQTLAEIERLSR